MALPKYVLPVLTLASLLTLSACGSGGGGGGSNPDGGTNPPPSVGVAEGFWTGLETTAADKNAPVGFKGELVVLEGVTPEFWYLRSQIINETQSVVFAVMQGQGQYVNGVFSATNTRYAQLLDGKLASIGKFSASYLEKKSFALQYAATSASPNGETFASDMGYQSEYDLTPTSFAALSGAWSSQRTGVAEDVLWSQSSDGTFKTGSFIGKDDKGAEVICELSGQLVARSTGKNVYDAAAAIAGTNCPIAGLRFRGIATYAKNASVNRIVVRLMDPDRTRFFVFLVTRPV